MLYASIIAVLLAALNAGMLYYYQIQSGYWLPKSEDGKWRHAPTGMWRSSQALTESKDLGYHSYSDLPADKRVEVDAKVDAIYPPDMMANAEYRNSFRSYVGTFGMWQWPLTLAALAITALTAAVADRKHLWLLIPLLAIGLMLQIDAWHRSYFSALGW